MKQYTLPVILILSGLLLSFVIAPKVIFTEINEKLAHYKIRQHDFETKIKTEVTDWLKEEDTKWVIGTKSISLDLVQLNQKAERKKNNFWLPDLYKFYMEVKFFNWQFADKIRIYEPLINLKTVFVDELQENINSETSFSTNYTHLKSAITENNALVQKHKDYMLAELDKAEKARQVWKNTIDNAKKLVATDFKEKTDTLTIHNMRDELHQESIFPHNRIMELEALYADYTAPTPATEERYNNYMEAITNMNNDYNAVRMKIKFEFFKAFHKVDSLFTVVNKGAENAIAFKTKGENANAMLELDKINMPFSLLDHEYTENTDGYFAFVSQDSLLNAQMNEIDKVKLDKAKWDKAKLDKTYNNTEYNDYNDYSDYYADENIIVNYNESVNMRILARKNALSGKWHTANTNLYQAGVKSDYNYKKLYKTKTSPRQQNSVSHDNYYATKKPDTKNWSAKSTSTPYTSSGKAYTSHSTPSHSYNSPNSTRSTARAYSPDYSTKSARTNPNPSSSTYKSLSSSTRSSSAKTSSTPYKSSSSSSKSSTSTPYKSSSSSTRSSSSSSTRSSPSSTRSDSRSRSSSPSSSSSRRK